MEGPVRQAWMVYQAMKWEPGRQGTGYYKMKLAQFLCFDLWLIKYPPYVKLPPHIDKIIGRKHYRINWVLKGKRFIWCSRPIFPAEKFCHSSRISVFRSDRFHSVWNMNLNTLVLSLGYFPKRQ